MSAFNKIPRTQPIKPRYNVGLMIDIPTGSYIRGIHGEWILNGGASPIMSITGPGNTFKSEILMCWNGAVFNRYIGTQWGFYDTENSMNEERLQRTINNTAILPSIKDHFSGEEPGIRLTQSSDLYGDQYFGLVKEMVDERKKLKPSRTFPVKSPTGEPIKLLPPLLITFDSLSELTVSAVAEGKFDKNLVGDSGNNTMHMALGAAKTQLMMQLPTLATNGNICFGMVSQVGQKIEMDQYAPQAAQLTHSKRGERKKGVPPKFEYLNTNLLEIQSAANLYNSSSDKTAMYPKSEVDRSQGFDLILVTMVNTRNKSGSSGFRISIIASQAEGVLVELSEFHHLKVNDYFGLIGGNRNYHSALYPECNLSRTTIRGKLDEDYRLRRSINILSEMLQIRTLWRNQPEHVYTKPEELYERIKSLGYDWDLLLNTRGYWMFEEDAKKEGVLPYLSTMDLLDMAEGLYHPYWYPIKKEDLPCKK